MDLTRLSDRTYYIKGPVNVGVITLEKSRVILVDSGIDSNYAQKIYELLSDYRYKIAYVLNTHSHADHVGGNNFFQKTCGCKILASPLEAPIIKYPLIQSALLFSGAPTQDLMNRFIMALPSEPEIFTENQLVFDDLKVDVLDLPGHSINQKGFLVDGTAFVADAVFPPQFFVKHKLPFNYDPMAELQTLETLKTLKAAKYVGGHLPETSSISDMAANHATHINNAIAFMRRLLKVPQSQERVVKGFLDHYGLKKTGWQYFLIRATVNGYLSALYKHNEIKYKVLDNLAVWYAA